jgi:mitogen-activated protein kinase kinase 1
MHEAIIFSNRWGSFRTASGTFKDGELRLNQSGLRLISEENGDVSVSS